MSNFHETAARKFDLNAIEAWAKYGHTGNAQHLESALWFEKAAAKHREKMAVAVEAKPVAVVEAKPVKSRCPHYRQIREFFAVAREMGLDVSEAARDRMRGSLGMLMGRPIESRADMSAADWAYATNAVRMARVWW